MPTATLVLVTYNSSDVLSACAQAMHHLDVAGGYEIIVVDNASHDDQCGSRPSMLATGNHYHKRV
jgi:glycosyltransferase involved in cell wall biosynthesis